MNGPRVTRRCFVATAGALGLLPAWTGERRVMGGAGTMPPVEGIRYRFFDVIEAAIVEAACERLIPGNAPAPGALAAGVPLYIDGQMAGSWGAGERTHREGYWQPGTPWHDPGRPSAPRDYFRAGLREVHRHFAARGIPFAQCEPVVQETYLRSLESGSAPLRTVSARSFFDLLVKMTVEGYFRHPQGDATSNILAWTLTGFPGAFARETPPREA